MEDTVYIPHLGETVFFGTESGIKKGVVGSITNKSVRLYPEESNIFNPKDVKPIANRNFKHIYKTYQDALDRRKGGGHVQIRKQFESPYEYAEYYFSNLKRKQAVRELEKRIKQVSDSEDVQFLQDSIRVLKKLKVY